MSAEAVQTALVASASVPQTQESPWRFLRSLDASRPGDEDLLKLTRGEELEIVTNLVLASKVTLLYAFSGNGKSSLINAGIIPHFARTGFALFRTRPRPPACLNDPVEAFRQCVLESALLPPVTSRDQEQFDHARASLAELPPAVRETFESVLFRAGQLIKGAQKPAESLRDFRAAMEEQKHLPLPEFVDKVAGWLGRETPMLFVLDQFEELFVHFYNRPELHSFASQLGEVLAAPDLRCRLLFSMREDWVGSMIAFKNDIPDIFASSYRLEPIRVSQVKPAIIFGAERSGRKIEPGLDQHILEDLSRFYSVLQKRSFTAVHLTPSRDEDPYIELPALQVVMEKLWEGVPDGAEISEVAYRLFAPESQNFAQYVLESYLGRMLDRIGQQDPPMHSAALRELRVDLLHQLTDGSAHRRGMDTAAAIEEASNRCQTHSDLADGPAAGFRNSEILEPLVEYGLVITSESHSGRTQCELAHDFLVRSVIEEWHKLDERRKVEAALAADRRVRDKEKIERFNVIERGGAWLTMTLAVLTFAVIAMSAWWWDAGHAEWNTIPKILCLVAPVFLFLLAAVFRSPPAIVLSIAAVAGTIAIGVLRRTTYESPYYYSSGNWNEQNILISSLLAPLVWIVLPVVAESLGVLRRATYSRSLAGAGIDSALPFAVWIPLFATEQSGAAWWALWLVLGTSFATIALNRSTPGMQLMGVVFQSRNAPDRAGWRRVVFRFAIGILGAMLAELFLLFFAAAMSDRFRPLEIGCISFVFLNCVAAAALLRYAFVNPDAEFFLDRWFGLRVVDRNTLPPPEQS